MNTHTDAFLFKVSIEENGETVASSRWEKVMMPEVVAQPACEIDPDNPYLNTELLFGD